MQSACDVKPCSKLKGVKPCSKLKGVKPCSKLKYSMYVGAGKLRVGIGREEGHNAVITYGLIT